MEFAEAMNLNNDYLLTELKIELSEKCKIFTYSNNSTFHILQILMLEFSIYITSFYYPVNLNVF